MPKTKSKHDQQLVVELMRKYCDPRGAYGWTPRKASKHISGKGDEARGEAPAEAIFADVSTISSSTIRRWYAPRAPNRGLASIGGRLQDRPGRYKHWETYGEYPYITAKRGTIDETRGGTWTVEQSNYLEVVIDKNPTFFLDEMADALESKFGFPFPPSAVSRQLTRLSYSRKLVYEKASQAIYREQQAFIATMRHLLKRPEMAIFVDESNKDRVAAKRKYGWSKVGTPVNHKLQFNRDVRYTLIGAANCFGFVTGACETIVHQYKGKEEHQPITAARFIQYTQERLCPVLGDYKKEEDHSIVFMDNCSVHNDDLETVRRLIEARGAILVYTAPYSPELIPIEYMFKTWKDYLKRHHIEFGRDWHKVHMDALRSITPQMGLNFFKNTTLVELVEHHPMSEEYAASAVDVAVMLAVGIL
jgi:hypothetical protein